jgi:RNA polymerase sigma-70 factor (ECF subfamily)
LAGSRLIEDAYAVYRNEICSFLARKTGDAHTAEDLTQEVFVAALSYRDRLEHDGRDLLPWLYTVAHRRYVDFVRAEQTRSVQDVTLDEPACVAVCSVDRPCPDQLIVGARSLSRAQSRVLLMRLVQGKSFAEIGRECGKSEAASRMCFQRARDSFRRFLVAAGTEIP